jgi:hypothetical protein
MSSEPHKQWRLHLRQKINRMRAQRKLRRKIRQQKRADRKILRTMEPELRAEMKSLLRYRNLRQKKSKSLPPE